MEALTLTETGQIMKKFNSLIDWWILEVPSTASPLMDTGRSILTINLLMEQFKGYLSYFGVGPATEQYPLIISGFNGVTTEPFSIHLLNNTKFTMRDKDMIVVQ